MRSVRSVAVVVALSMATAGCTGAKRPEASKLSVGSTTTTPAVASGEPGVDAPADTVPVAGAAADGAAPAPGAPAAGAGGTPAAGAPKASGGSAAPGGPTAGSTGGGQAATGPSAPADAPGDPDLFAGSSNTRGITDKEIRICGHAALTFGPAFNATPDDFNVYYSAVNDAGGVFGRRIVATYENDNYDPKTAVEAADLCRAKNPFMILGGIGFDQIPAVRNWAEQNKELYFHHIATVRGSEGKQYSYTTQPTVERVGEAFGQLAAARFKDKKIGVLYRNSEFWQPGFEAFKRKSAELGFTIVKAVPVEKNQGAYQQALLELKNAGAQVVFGWENTLALSQMVAQAKQQDFHPIWLAFPFNLTAQTLGDDALKPPMVGLASWPGYSKGDYSGTFASYAEDMREFERQYAKYRPNTDIGGVAGDLLWLNWVEQKRIVELLRACGPSCTRNHLVGVLVNGYKASTSPACPLDFSGGRHDGSGGLVSVMETYKSPSGKVNWRSTKLCALNDF